jgi:glutathione-regulated potassium-efflux system ancillary protein KefG
MDLVLEHGWAHGEGGDHLVGKPIFNAITSGGTRASFSPDGFNRHTLPELLRPLEQATRLCRMPWLPPFAVQGTYRLTDAMLADYADRYRRALLALAEAQTLEPVMKYELLNDWIADRIRQEQP